jgi:hypothetical protein
MNEQKEAKSRELVALIESLRTEFGMDLREVETLIEEGLSNAEEKIESLEEDNRMFPGEEMDGDFDSGMASAGYGTDEDYGYYGGNEE